MALSIAPIENKEVWEEFLSRHSPKSLFQSWDWGNVQKNLGVQVWRVGLFEDGILIGVAQIVKVKARRGTFLHIRHGPVLAVFDKAHLQIILSYCKKLSHTESAWFVRISPLIDDFTKHRLLFSSLALSPSPIHAMDAELCWVLDLDVSEDELLLNMRKSTRYDIKKAEKMGVEIRFSFDTKDIDIFTKLYERTSKRHDFVPHKGIVEEFDIFAKEGKAALVFGRHNGEVLAGALLLFYGNQAIYHHGASVVSTVPASAFVQWAAIREAKKRGSLVYNFWGIAPENNSNHPWRGITLFKKGFGGRQIEYLHAHDLATHPLYVIPYMVEKLRRLRKRY